MADRLAATRALETKTGWLKGQDRRKGKERGRERAGGVERGSPASLCQGFPQSHLGCVNPRLAQAHSWILTSPLSVSPQHLLPLGPDNKRACLHAAEKRAEGRHFLETVANNSRELVSVSSEWGRKAGNWPIYHNQRSASSSYLPFLVWLSQLTNYSADY